MTDNKAIKEAFWKHQGKLQDYWAFKCGYEAARAALAQLAHSGPQPVAQEPVALLRQVANHCRGLPVSDPESVASVLGPLYSAPPSPSHQPVAPNKEKANV